MEAATKARSVEQGSKPRVLLSLARLTAAGLFIAIFPLLHQLIDYRYRVNESKESLFSIQLAIERYSTDHGSIYYPSPQWIEENGIGDYMPEYPPNPWAEKYPGVADPDGRMMKVDPYAKDSYQGNFSYIAYLNDEGKPVYYVLRLHGPLRNDSSEVPADQSVLLSVETISGKRSLPSDLFEKSKPADPPVAIW